MPLFSAPEYHDNLPGNLDNQPTDTSLRHFLHLTMHQYISRAVSRGQTCLFKSNLCGTVLSASSSLPIYRFAAVSQSSRYLATATRSYTPISRAPTPPPTKSSEEFASSPYYVRRTSSVQLPVYRRFMSGGNRQVVVIKKVDGDRKKLLEDLVESLGVGKDDIRINPTTQHVELKVRYS